MKVLVIGQGGREHAIVKALALSPRVTEIHVLPGNPGMSKEAVCHDFSWKDTDKLISFCKRTEIDFVVIGPEDPLVNGLGNTLRQNGISCVGPNADGARLEGSKIFAKSFMVDAKIPTAKYVIVSSLTEIKNALPQYSPPYVLKADGLAAGKGVFICKTKEELFEAAENLFEKKTLGAAGEKALLEQFTPGWELSFLVLTNGESYQCLPIAQDHKRLSDNDEGPNTGGMGTFAPMQIPETLLLQIENTVVKPSVGLLYKNKIQFRGVLFIGLMINENGPSVLEFNTRFGDPEAQVILPMVDGDWGVILHELSRGNLIPLKWKKMFSCCVVMASEGYPDAPKKGVMIDGDPLYSTPSSYFVHAGAAFADGQWTTNGGRVLGAVGLGSTCEEAISNAYKQKENASWSGMQVRTDIGAKSIMN